MPFRTNKINISDKVHAKFVPVSSAYQYNSVRLHSYIDMQNLLVRIMRELCLIYLFYSCEKAHEHWVIVTDKALYNIATKQQLVVTHTIRQTEIPALIHSSVTNTPSFKNVVSREEIFSPCIFAKTYVFTKIQGEKM